MVDSLLIFDGSLDGKLFLIPKPLVQINNDVILGRISIVRMPFSRSLDSHRSQYQSRKSLTPVRLQYQAPSTYRHLIGLLPYLMTRS
jgi:hypothetical protein